MHTTVEMHSAPWRKHLLHGVWLALATFTCFGADADDVVQVGGSDLLGAAVADVVESWSAETGRATTVAFAGSLPAHDRLRAGSLDLVVLIDDPARDDMDPLFAVVPVAYATAVIAAPRSLPVEQVNVAQLRQVFSANSAVATTRWGDFGATGSWANLPITPHVVTPAQGLSQVLLVQHVLAPAGVHREVRAHDRQTDALAAMAVEEGALGVVPWLPGDHGRFKRLLVAAAAGDVAFGPTPENLHAGDYPLAVALRLVFRREDATRLLPWLRLWLGEEMAEALRHDLLVPLPRTARNQAVLDLELID